MPDQLDQLSDAQAHASKGNGQGAREERTTHVTAYVCKIKGKWIVRKYDGPLSSCNEAFDEVITSRGARFEKHPWARAFMDGKQLVVHPKTDPEAEQEAIKALNSKRKPTPITKQY